MKAKILMYVSAFEEVCLLFGKSKGIHLLGQRIALLLYGKPKDIYWGSG